MSATSDSVDLIKVKSSILDIKEKIKFPVISAPSQVTAMRVEANSKSTSNLSFNVVLPNESTIASRHILLDVTFTVTYTYPISAAAGNVMLMGTTAAVSPFPFTNGFCQNLQVFVNNSSISSPLSEIFSERWLSTLNEEEFTEYDGLCPYKSDNYKRYADAILAGSNNPFSSFNSSSFTKPCGRGNVQMLQSAGGNWTTGGGAISRTMKYRVVEPLFLKPFLQRSGGPDEGLIGVNSLNINYTLNPNSKTFFCEENAAALSAAGLGAVTVLTSVDEAFLRMSYYTLSDMDRIPLRNSLPIEDLTRYVTTIPDSADGATLSVTSQAIQLGVIPSRLFVFCRRKLTDRTAAKSFSYYNHNTATPLSITFDNKNALLNSHSVEQLFLISKKNGYAKGINQFRGFATNPLAGPVANGLNPGIVYTQGPVFIIKPEDLSLDPRLSAGCTANVSLQVTMQITNNFGEAVDVSGEMIIIAQNDGVMSTVSGSTYINSTMMDSKDVVSAKTSQKGCSSDELANIMSKNMSISSSDALGILGDISQKSGSAMSGGGSRSGGRSKASDLDSLLF